MFKMGNSYKLKQVKYKHQWNIHNGLSTSTFLIKTGWLGTSNRKECEARVYKKSDHLSKVTTSIDNTD